MNQNILTSASDINKKTLITNTYFHKQIKKLSKLKSAYSLSNFRPNKHDDISKHRNKHQEIFYNKRESVMGQSHFYKRNYEISEIKQCKCFFFTKLPDAVVCIFYLAMYFFEQWLRRAHGNVVWVLFIFSNCF